MPKPDAALDCAIDHALSQIRRVGDPAKLPPPVRTVLLVHTAQGVIDNGGLRYFFESDFPGQPPYSTFVDAFRDIGADAQADALASAAQLFPFPDPHKFQRRRDEFLDRWMDGSQHRPGSAFKPFDDTLCGNADTWRLLGQYVRRHAHAFPQ